MRTYIDMTLSTRLNYTQRHFPEPVKEFDIASYRNRFYKSYTVFKAQEEKFIGWVYNIEDAGWQVNRYNKKLGAWEEILFPLGSIEPLYYPVRAGLYPGVEDPDSVLTVRRRLVKT